MKIINKTNTGEIIEFNQPKKYTFLRKLGSGGTGTTILLEDSILNRKLVSKMYTPEKEENREEYFKRFVDEIKIMFSIYHNNIIRIYDYYLYPEVFTGYIMMEYVNGMNIEDYFLFEENEKINAVFIQLIQAFEYLERHHILHRDIRPHNIMVDEYSNIKLIDFGFGKQMRSSTDENASIILNWPVTKHANEVYRGIYNNKTEIYYIGCLIKNIIIKYDMTCFKFENILDLMIEVDENKRISSFENINKKLSESYIDELNFTMKQKETYQKFADALIDSISKIINGRVYERNDDVIMERLNEVILKNSLENFICEC